MVHQRRNVSKNLWRCGFVLLLGFAGTTGLLQAITNGVTYVSTSSSTVDWPGTLLDAYQNTSSNFLGPVAGPYNPGGDTYFSGKGDTLLGYFCFTEGFNSWINGKLFWQSEMGVIDGQFTMPDGKILQLDRNMILGPNATLSVGNSAGAEILSNGATIFLKGDDVSLQGQMTVNGGLVIDGGGHLFSLDADGRFTLEVADTLTLRNMDLAISDGYSLWNGDISSSLILEDVNIIARVTTPGSPYILCSTGTQTKTLQIEGEVSINGFNQLVAVNGDLEIGANATLYVGPGVTLYGIRNIYMTDETSTLYLDGCSLYTGFGASAKMQITKGLLLLDNKVELVNTYYAGPINTDMTQGLILGDGIDSANDVNVRLLGGAYTVLQGCLYMNNVA